MIIDFDKMYLLVICNEMNVLYCVYVYIGLLDIVLSCCFKVFFFLKKNGCRNRFNLFDIK